MQVEKKRNFIIRFLYFTIICLIVYFLSKYVIPMLAPFIVGLLVAILVRSLVKMILKKYKINRTIITVVLLVLVYALIIFLVMAIGGRVAIYFKDYLLTLPEKYTRDIQPAINKLSANITQKFPYLRDTINASANNINDSVIKFIEKASSTFVNSLTNIAGTISSILLKMVFTIISSVIFAIDLPTIEGFIKRQMDDRTLYVYNNVLYNIGNTLLKFIKAYLIIITVTFLELAIGLSIIGVKNAVFTALGIAILDILPVVGTGTIMVPWIIYALIMSNYKLAIGLAILYGVIFIVRQIIEPKVVGDSIGIHPIVILACIFIGGRLFGIIGIFLFPITLTIIKKLNDDKVINILK